MIMIDDEIIENNNSEPSTITNIKYDRTIRDNFIYLCKLRNQYVTDVLSELGVSYNDYNTIIKDCTEVHPLIQQICNYFSVNSYEFVHENLSIPYVYRKIFLSQCSDEYIKQLWKEDKENGYCLWSYKTNVKYPYYKAILLERIIMDTIFSIFIYIHDDNSTLANDCKILPCNTMICGSTENTEHLFSDVSNTYHMLADTSNKLLFSWIDYVFANLDIDFKNILQNPFMRHEESGFHICIRPISISDKLQEEIINRLRREFNKVSDGLGDKIYNPWKVNHELQKLKAQISRTNLLLEQMKYRLTAADDICNKEIIEKIYRIDCFDDQTYLWNMISILDYKSDEEYNSSYIKDFLKVSIYHQFKWPTDITVHEIVNRLKAILVGKQNHAIGLNKAGIEEIIRKIYIVNKLDSMEFIECSENEYCWYIDGLILLYANSNRQYIISRLLWLLDIAKENYNYFSCELQYRYGLLCLINGVSDHSNTSLVYTSYEFPWAFMKAKKEEPPYNGNMLDMLHYEYKKRKTYFKQECSYYHIIYDALPMLLNAATAFFSEKGLTLSEFVLSRKRRHELNVFGSMNTNNEHLDIGSGAMLFNILKYIDLSHCQKPFAFKSAMAECIDGHFYISGKFPPEYSVLRYILSLAEYELKKQFSIASAKTPYFEKTLYFKDLLVKEEKTKDDEDEIRMFDIIRSKEFRTRMHVAFTEFYKQNKHHIETINTQQLSFFD